jgi:hypothetical protein
LRHARNVTLIGLPFAVVCSQLCNFCRYNDSQTVDEIKLALQAGFRSIDTAFDYGDEVRTSLAPMHHHTCTITPCTITPITITPCNVIRTPRPPSFSAHTSVYGDEVRTSLAPMHHHTCTITPCTITPITITPCNAIRTPRPPSFSAHTSVYGDEVRTSLAPLHHHTCTITPYHHTNNHHTMQRHTHTPTAIVFGSYLCLR